MPSFNGEYLAKLRARTWLFRALSPSFSSVLAKRDNHVLACNFVIFFTHRLSNIPFLIWLLITPPHHKYVATLPCNLSLMACFTHINVSQGSVATYAKCGGIFDIRLTANLPRNLPVNKFLKSAKNWQNYGHESVSSFFGPPCTYVLLFFSATFKFTTGPDLGVFQIGGARHPQHLGISHFHNIFQDTHKRASVESEK